MQDFTYYLINLAIFVPVLILSFKSNIKPHRHVSGLIAGYLFVSLPFLIWNFWAVNRGLWSFSATYTAGPQIFGIPLDVILLFITVPFAMIYLWGVIKKFIGDIGIPAVFPLIAMGLVAASSVWALIYYWGNGTTRTVAIAALIMVVVALGSRLTFTLRFWTFQLVLLGLFLVFGSLLGMMPLVVDNAESMIGFNLLGIPIEHYFYVFTFVDLFLLAYHKADTPHLLR